MSRSILIRSMIAEAARPNMPNKEPTKINSAAGGKAKIIPNNPKIVSPAPAIPINKAES